MSKNIFGLLRKKGNLKQAAGFNISDDGNIKISVKKCDEIIQFHNQNICIKCDVEGHELEAFKGMEKLLKDNRCFLQIEIWEDNYQELNQYLIDSGYKFTKKIIGEYYYQNF